MHIEKLVDLATNFVGEVLHNEEYFRNVQCVLGWDLVLLGGSCLRGFSDEISDLDIFLVTSSANQRRFGLTPVHNYQYAGVNIDVSMIATEKVVRDADNKAHYNWWNGFVVLFSDNDSVKKKFEQASTFQYEDFLDKAWTAFVVYEINSYNIKQCKVRGDFLSAYTCLAQNVQELIEVVLADAGIYCHNKWYGRNLKKISAALHDLILNLYCVDKGDVDGILQKNLEMKSIFIEILSRHGFRDEEIANCEKCNLDRLLFQKT